MKKVLSMIVMLTVLFLCGCADHPQVPPDSSEITSVSNQASKNTTKGVGEFCENTAKALFSQEGADSQISTVLESPQVTKKSVDTNDAQSVNVSGQEDSVTDAAHDAKNDFHDEPESASEPAPTPPQAMGTPKPAEPPKPTEPAPTEPSPPEPAPTVPVPTEPQPTEPAGCTHNWQCVHHDEEGHWLAGVICDCGWVIYGSPDEVSAAWNAHSASFPPEESLLEHGGFGCVDEWVVDTPAYEEWYCSLCGETKP